MQTVSGLFDTYEDAATAVRELHAAGIADTDISLVSGDRGAAEAVPSPSKRALDVANGVEGGAGAGVLLGGAGGLLAGLRLLAIPGIGPVVAGGWLLATAAGAAAGAVLGGTAGGIVGALVAGGVPEADAHVFSEGIRRGGTLVTAKAAAGQIDQAKAILDDNDAIDIDERRTAYAAEGWTGFDANGKPRSNPDEPPREPILPPFL